MLSRGLDTATAATIWNRFRSGQRGFMVRSIYSEEGRRTFDDVNRRFRGDAVYREAATQFLREFEGVLRQSEGRDPGGQGIQSQLLSDLGRAYLMLAHVAGRLV